jgi:NAD(P)-dependent dehydrogenase (short-subunit alcohol dehydrogenase family)
MPEQNGMGSMTGFTDADVPDQSGKCFMVTGANTGLGYETTRVLASKGARVLLACRDEVKARAAMARISAQVREPDLAFILLDQADLASVRVAADIVRQEKRLDCLVNNAGIMASSVGYTKDGFEQHVGVNHLGTFALTHLLLPKVLENRDGRIVITSSLIHKSGQIDFDNLVRGEGVKPSQQYANSKLANLLFLFELNSRLRKTSQPVLAAGCHPGLAATELSRDVKPIVKLFAPLLGKLVNSALQGSWPTLQAATGTDVEPGGYYGPQKFGGAKGPSGPATRSAQSQDPDLAARLWRVSAELTGVNWDPY